MKKYVILYCMLMKQTHIISMESISLDTIDKRLILSSLHTDYNKGIVALSATKNPAAQDDKGRTRMHYAVLLNDRNIVRLLAEPQTETSLANIQDTQGETPIHLLLASTPLMEFQNQTTLDLCSLLLTHSADPKISNKAGENALHYTVKHQSSDSAFLEQRPKLIELFIQHGVPIDSPNTEGETALHYLFRTEVITHTAINTRIALLPTLLACGANPNAVTHMEETPLHYALKYKEMHDAYNIERQKAIKLLVKHGACVNSTTPSLETPLHFAFKIHDHNEHGTGTEFRLQLARTLLELGADPNAQNKLGITPFYALVSTPCTDSKHALGFWMLYKHSANPNLKTLEGYTPLHRAVCARQLRWVQMLVSHMAPSSSNATDTTVTNNPTLKRALTQMKGKTAFDMALELVLLPSHEQGVNGVSQLKLEKVNAAYQDAYQIFTLLLKDLFKKAVEKVNDSSNVDAT